MRLPALGFSANDAANPRVHTVAAATRCSTQDNLTHSLLGTVLSVRFKFDTSTKPLVLALSPAFTAHACEA